jgi:hypothetical protein
MLSLKKILSIKTLNKSAALLLFILLVLAITPIIASSQNHPCKNASVQLRGDLDVIMNRGGLWALMEQTEGLQDKSVLGLQLDGKLARLVGQFEEMCAERKYPTKELFDTVTNLLGEARTIWNPSSSGEAILQLINPLNKKIDTLLSKIK